MPQPDLLLIEDDEAIAELIVWHFAREGFSVRQTPDGEQALILVEERVPDIVLLDWMIESLPGIEVCRRLRPALAGEMLTYADIELDSVAHKVVRGSQTVAMGPTEFRLLRHFMEHPGRVVSRGQLLDSVWGQDSDIELRTVDVHIRRLRKAINLPGTADNIRTVRSAGYALDAGKG